MSHAEGSMVLVPCTEHRYGPMVSGDRACQLPGTHTQRTYGVCRPQWGIQHWELCPHSAVTPEMLLRVCFEQ